MPTILERLEEFVRARDGRDEYEPLESGEGEGEERIEAPVGRDGKKFIRFSWVDYGIFVLLGTSMLWAWNMFLAANPYFQRRFKSNESILANFQSAELSVSTAANLGTILVLTKLQAKADYPRRINIALLVYTVTFTLLAISTRVFLDVSAGVYFGFIMVTVFATSMATGFFQNGIFAYMSALGREEYLQGNMTGQAVAGVLPCIVQIVSVLSVPNKKTEGNVPQESSTAAFAYFMTATGVSALTLVSFFVLLTRHGEKGKRKHSIASMDPSGSTSDLRARNAVPLRVLFRKLFWLAAAVFLTFAITMVFPVFTQRILSVRPAESAPRLFQPSAFIPLALLFWNLGDLGGRLLCAVPKLSMASSPRVLFAGSIARVVFIPLYFLCNVNDGGAAVNSDSFYFLVQLLFGLTNGYIGSQCMMAFVDYVDVDEREAAGAFMSTTLVAGLAVGSFSSFFVASYV